MAISNDNDTTRITVEYDDGRVEERNVGGIFEANGTKYAFLTSENTSTNGEVEFISLAPVTDDSGNEDFVISPITTQEEYDAVLSAFNDYINDLIAEDEQERVTVEFKTDNGTVSCELLDFFYLNRRNYAALYYENSNTIDFMRAEVSEDNDNAKCRFTSITSELEYERVKDYYKQTYLSDGD